MLLRPSVAFDDATNDLFAWWEEAATVNRAAVREVADLYFARFDARLEKGLAEVRSELAVARSDMDKALAEVRAEMGSGFAEVRSEMKTRLAEVRTEMASLRADMIKWMFMFWVGTIVPLAGLIIALTKL